MNRPMRVVVTSSSFGKVTNAAYDILRTAGLDVLDNERGPFTGQKLIEVLSRGEAAIVGQDTVDRNVLESCPNLKVIAKHGTGVDNIDLGAARECNIVITNVPSLNADAVAEYTVGLMLALGRRIAEADRGIRSGRWLRLMGSQVGGKTVGIVGFGRIGQLVAKKLRGLEPRILVSDPYPNAAALETYGAELVGLDELLARSDIVTLHLPLVKDTEGLIDANRLGLMKASAVLINTARAGVVDDKALVDCLRAGQIAGAAVDVFAEEPVGSDHPLLSMEQVVLSPHIASYSAEAIDDVSIQAARNVVDVLQRHQCPYVVS